METNPGTTNPQTPTWGPSWGWISSSSRISLSFKTLILSEVSLFQTQVLCLEVPESNWTEETAAHLCNKPAASPDQESWMTGNLEKVKISYWFISHPSVSWLSGFQPILHKPGAIWTDKGRICTKCTAGDAGQREEQNELIFVLWTASVLRALPPLEAKVENQTPKARPQNAACDQRCHHCTQHSRFSLQADEIRDFPSGLTQPTATSF